MAVITASALLVLAVGRLLPTAAGAAGRVIELLALAVLVVAVLALLGYLFDVRSLYSIGPLSTMAVHTAAALLLLAGATLAVVPAGSVPWLVHGHDAGAVLLPAAGYLRLVGERAGLYDTGFGLALMVVAAMALVAATTGYTARTLRRIDERREAALTALQMVNQHLEQRVVERANQLDTERGISALLRDRERIAADVHDLVVQRLYAVALTLQSEAGRAVDPEVVETAVDGIDDAMRELRGTIFQLKHRPDEHELTATLDEVIAGAAAILPTEPEVTLQGDPTRVPQSVVVHLLAVLREAVSNAVRHARPETLSIDLDIAATEVTLTVADDGCGLDPSVVATSGLRNMVARAEALGGSCRWQPGVPRGTTVVWRVPLTIAHAIATGARPTLRAQLTAAMLRVGRAATTDESDDPLLETARVIADLVDADCVAVLTDEDGETLQIRCTHGFPPGADPVGTRVPRAGSLAEHVLSSGEALRVDDIRTMSAVRRQLGDVQPFGPALIVPLRGASGLHGAVSTARLAGRAPFSAAEEEAASTLGLHVALALELGHALSISRPVLAADAR